MQTISAASESCIIRDCRIQDKPALLGFCLRCDLVWIYFVCSCNLLSLLIIFCSVSFSREASTPVYSLVSGSLTAWFNYSIRSGDWTYDIKNSANNIQVLIDNFRANFRGIFCFNNHIS